MKVKKYNSKVPTINAITRMTEEVLNSYKHGYQVDKIILTSDIYEEFKILMLSKNTSIGVLQFIDNQECWNGIQIIINEDEWEFDSVIAQAIARIPDGYKSDIELKILENEAMDNNRDELLESEPEWIVNVEAEWVGGDI